MNASIRSMKAIFAAAMLIVLMADQAGADDQFTFEYTTVRGTISAPVWAEICGKGIHSTSTAPFLVTLAIRADNPTTPPLVPVSYSTVTDPAGNFCFYVPYPDPNAVRGIYYEVSGALMKSGT